MKQVLKLFLDVFGRESYIVGGAPRDMLLKRPLMDLDIAVRGGSGIEKKLRFIARKKSLSFFPLDKKEQTYRMIMKKPYVFQIDIAALRGEDIAEDLKKRDFTINSMAYPMEDSLKLKFEKLKQTELKKKGLNKAALKITGLKRKKILGLSDGIKDLERKRIAFSNADRAIEEDPLRMLRAFRIASQLDFKIDRKSLAAIKKHSSKTLQSSPERIHDELMLILKNPDSAAYVKELFKHGILTAIFPDLKPQITCAEVYYGKGGVLKHTFRVLERIEYLFKNARKIVPNYKKVSEFFEDKEGLKITALLHDIAKPPKAAYVKDRLRFFGHEEYGAIMSERIMKELRFSNRRIKLAYNTIAQHLRPGNLASNNLISDRAIFRFFRDMGDYTFHLLILCWADHSSYISIKQLDSVLDKIKQKPFPIPPKGLPATGITKTVRFLQVINLLFATYAKKSLKLKKGRLINGKDIIRILKIKEGPQIGRILNKISMLYFEDKIKTRKDALRYLNKNKKMLENMNKEKKRLRI